jgi:hypothetical protein
MLFFCSWMLNLLEFLIPWYSCLYCQSFFTMILQIWDFVLVCRAHDENVSFLLIQQLTVHVVLLSWVSSFLMVSALEADMKRHKDSRRIGFSISSVKKSVRQKKVDPQILLHVFLEDDVWQQLLTFSFDAPSYDNFCFSMLFKACLILDFCCVHLILSRLESLEKFLGLIKPSCLFWVLKFLPLFSWNSTLRSWIIILIKHSMLFQSMFIVNVQIERRSRDDYQDLRMGRKSQGYSCSSSSL